MNYSKRNNEELYPYQRFGASWLATKTLALLADEMGLGKSAQAIHAADKAGCNRVLVICPAAARVNWAREFERFSDSKRTFQILESSRTAIENTSSLILSYDLASRIQAHKLGSFDLCIADESHFLKGRESKRTTAILGVNGHIRICKRFWALSGTPAPNHFGEMWPILYTFGVTSLPYSQFINRYCTYYEWKNRLVVTGTKSSMIAEIKSTLTRIMLRRKKEEVMKELPPITYSHVLIPPGKVDLEVDISFVKYVTPIDTTSELQKILDKEKFLLEETLARTGLGEDGMKLLEGMAKSVSTLRRYTGLQKVEPVAEIISQELEANAYEKIVIFAIHRGVIEGLRVKLAKFGAVTLYGGTSPETRQRNIDLFQNSPKTRVFIGNIQSAGTAITLTAAHQVVFAESEWVPASMAQAAMRCHRIGQTKNVSVRFFALSNSIDERISTVLKRKTKELTDIF